MCFLVIFPPPNFFPWSLPFGRGERYQQKCTSNLNFMSKNCKLLQNIENSVSLKYVSLSSVPPRLSFSLHCTQHASWCLNCFPICSICNLCCAIYAWQINMHCLYCIEMSCLYCNYVLRQKSIWFPLYHIVVHLSQCFLCIPLCLNSSVPKVALFCMCFDVLY